MPTKRKALFVRHHPRARFPEVRRLSFGKAESCCVDEGEDFALVFGVNKESSTEIQG